MTKLYQKSEITFAILWIAAYVVLSSYADQLSESIGIVKSATAVLQIAMSLILFFWIRSNNLSEKYGFCKSKVPAKYFLYYLPLVIIASTAFWGGFGLQYGFPDTLMYMISMCCVGFLEEVIFRGLLSIIVSSLTFGIGHIVNLFNGSGRDPASSVIQVIFAVLVGFVLVLIFYYGKSLVPCIIFHSANNALKVFEADGSFSPQIEMVMNLVAIFVVLGGYVFYLVKVFPEKAEQSKT